LIDCFFRDARHRGEASTGLRRSEWDYK
jgi:hypothetical protein